MKASEARGIILTAANDRVKEHGYTSWEEFLESTGLGDEEFTEVTWILQDMLEPYFKKVRSQ